MTASAEEPEGPRASDWAARLDAHVVRVQSAGLARGVDYLEAAYQPGEGWGRMPGLGPELRATALAVEALVAASGEVRWDLENVSLGFRQRPDDQPAPSIADLVDLLVLVRTAEGDAAAAPITKLLLDRLERSPELERRLTTGTLGALLVAADVEGARPQAFDPWLERLLDRQLPSGAWPAGPAGEPSDVATATAIRAIHSRPEPRTQAALRRAGEWLEEQVETLGWDGLGTGRDVPTKALILRALAEHHRADAFQLQEGADWLVAVAHTDGGWGSMTEGTSTVEATATVVIALAAAGQHEYVPGRLALAAVEHLEAAAAERAEELERLEARIAEEVERRGGRLSIENRKLKSRQQELELALADARNEAETARRVADEVIQFARPRRSAVLGGSVADPYWRFLRVVVAGVAVFGTTAVVILRPQDWLDVAAIGTVALLALTGAVLGAYFESRRRRDVIRSLAFSAPESDAPMARRVNELRVMSSEWPPPVNEVVFTSILPELEGVAAREVPDFIAYRTSRLGLSASARRDLTDWATWFAMLSPIERRLVVEQLRRSTLGLW